MSFQTSREYPRHILRPIGLPANTAQHVDQELLSRSSSSKFWTATAHVFRGTSDRVNPLSWPSSKFNDDPRNIPDDPAHNQPYDPKSAEPRPDGSRESIYTMYKTANLSSDAQDVVPAPIYVTKRYVPINQSTTTTASNGMTILMLSGMGLPKEVFEPMIDNLITKHHSNDLNIAEIWTIDMPMSGATALANPPGYLYGNEKDIARDLLLFTTSYLPLHPSTTYPPPFHLPARNPPTTTTRSNLHIAAHSLGAQSALLVAAHAPDLYSSITVFDPAIIPAGKIQQAFTTMPKDVLCAGIPFEHASSKALEAHIRKNKRTRGWDDQVVKLFVEYGTVEAEAGKEKVKLVAHPRLEWALYYDQQTPSQTYDRLQDVRTPLNAVMPARPFAVPAKMFERDLMRLPGETRLTFVEGATHQLPFEKVRECSDLLVAWLMDRKGAAGERSAKL